LEVVVGLSNTGASAPLPARSWCPAARAVPATRCAAAPAPGAGLPTGTARTRSLASASKDLGRQSAPA